MIFILIEGAMRYFYPWTSWEVFGDSIGEKINRKIVCMRVPRCVVLLFFFLLLFYFSKNSKFCANKFVNEDIELSSLLVRSNKYFAGENRYLVFQLVSTIGQHLGAKEQTTRTSFLMIPLAKFNGNWQYPMIFVGSLESFCITETKKYHFCDGMNYWFRLLIISS